VKTVRGERPVYLGDTHVDRLLSAVVLLTQEVGVLQRRVALLEQAAGLEAESPGAASDAMARLVTELTARRGPTTAPVTTEMDAR
jgi:hypothetical protein